MFLKILLGTVILVLLSALILAIRYYKQRQWPLCSAFSKNLSNYKNCMVCGAERVEDCAKDNHSSK
jgi:hypothetical protein